MELHSLPCLPHLRGQTGPRWPSECMAENGEHLTAGNSLRQPCNPGCKQRGRAAPLCSATPRGAGSHPWPGAAGEDGAREAAALWGASPLFPDMKAVRC